MSALVPLTRRATRVYREATDAQRAAGETWYKEAHEVARSQVGTYGVTIEVAAGVIAATSPRLGWGPNVMLSERMLASGGTLRHGALSRSLEHARRIVAGEPPLEVLRGPKTRSFYVAILTAGARGTAVIDRHAWDMLVGKRHAAPPTSRQYLEGADKIQRAARIIGVTTHTMQATTWLAHRSKFWSENAYNIRDNEGASA